MDPATIMALAQLGVSLGELGYGLFAKPELSDQMQKYMDLLSRRAEEGLSPGTESSMLRSGSRQIAGQTAAMQARGAAALASQGVSRSSAARNMISSVNRTQGEMFAQLQDSIRRLDEQVKAQAMGQLGGATAMAEASLEKQKAAKGQMIAGGLAGLLDKDVLADLGLMEPEMSEFEKNLQLIKKYFPEQQAETVALGQLDMLNLYEQLDMLDLQKLLQSIY